MGVGVSFSTFKTFVDNNRAASNDTLLKLDVNENGGFSGIVAKPAGDDRIRTSFFQSRTAEQKEINNRIRNAFMKAVLNECGVSDASKLPQNVKDVMNLSDYQGFFTLNSSLRADRDNSTFGRPLSMRRIRAVVSEVNDYKMRRAQETLAAVGRKIQVQGFDGGRAFKGQQLLDAAEVISFFTLAPAAGFEDAQIGSNLAGRMLVGKLPGVLDQLANRQPPGSPITRTAIWQALKLGEPPDDLEQMSSDDFSRRVASRLLEIARQDAQSFRMDLLNAPDTPLVDLNSALKQGLKYDSAVALLTQRKFVVEHAQEVLTNAGKILGIEAFDLNTCFTGKKRLDAATVLSLIDLESGFGGGKNNYYPRIILPSRLPGVLDELANRQPPNAPITRTMLWQAMKLGAPPQGLEDMPRDHFSRILAAHLVNRAEKDCENIPFKDGQPPLIRLSGALITGLTYEAALDILSSGNKPVGILSFVAPPAIGNAINNPSSPEQLLESCKSTLAWDLTRMGQTKCTFEGNLLFDTEVKGKGLQQQGKSEQKNRSFINDMVAKINAVALQKRGRELSDREMAGLLGCLAQQGGQILSALDADVFRSTSNREINFSFDDQGRIKVSIKPLYPERLARDYQIEATIHENGGCIIDKLIVSKKARDVAQEDMVSIAKTLSDVGRSLGYQACDLNEAFSGTQRADAATAFSLLGLPTNDLQNQTWGGVRGHILISKLPAALERLAQRGRGTPITRGLLWEALGAGNPPDNLMGMSKAEFATTLSNRLFDFARRDYKLSPTERRVKFEGPLSRTLMTGLKYESAMELHNGQKSFKDSDFLTPQIFGERMDPSAKSPAEWLSTAKEGLEEDLSGAVGCLYRFGDTHLFDANDLYEKKSADVVIEDLLVKVNKEVKTRRGTDMSDMEKAGLLTCFRQKSANFLATFDAQISQEKCFQNREISLSFDDQNRIKVLVTPRDPNSAIRDYRIEATLNEDGTCIVDNFWLGSRTKETLVNAEKIISPGTFDLATVFTGQKQHDAATVLSLIDLRRGEYDQDFAGYMLLGLLPGVLGKLANRQPPNAPITRTMLWKTLGIGVPPQGLEDMPRNEFSRILAERLVGRANEDCRKFQPPARLKEMNPLVYLQGALKLGLTYESAVDILTFKNREIGLSDFVAPPSYGNAINNHNPTEELLKNCKRTILRDFIQMHDYKCTFEGEILLDTEKKGGEVLKRGNDINLNENSGAVDNMLKQINRIAKQKRGKELSDQEMAGLLGCMGQQTGDFPCYLDTEAFHDIINNKELNFSFDNQGRIKVSIKPVHPERFGRGYQIEATIHENGVCIIDKLWVGARTEETLVNAGKILGIEAFDLNTCFTGKKRFDAAAVLSLIDLKPEFEFDNPQSHLPRIMLPSILPGVLDELANRQPPNAPITRTMLWKTLGIGVPPQGLEDMPRDRFSRILAAHLVNRAEKDCNEIQIPNGGINLKPLDRLTYLLLSGVKYEAALNILSSAGDNEITLSDFVTPPVIGNAINNSRPPDVLLQKCKQQVARDIHGINNSKCTLEDNLLFDTEKKDSGLQLKGKRDNQCMPFVTNMLEQINRIALQKRGRELSDREMAGLLGCIGQQSAGVLSSLDGDVLSKNNSNRDLRLSFDDQGRIKVSIKPLYPERLARDYQIEATIHENGVCIIDKLHVSARRSQVA